MASDRGQRPSPWGRPVDTPLHYVGVVVPVQPPTKMAVVRLFSSFSLLLFTNTKLHFDFFLFFSSTSLACHNLPANHATSLHVLLLYKQTNRNLCWSTIVTNQPTQAETDSSSISLGDLFPVVLFFRHFGNWLAPPLFWIMKLNFSNPVNGAQKTIDIKDEAILYVVQALTNKCCTR